MHPLMTSDLPPPADMKNLKERTTKAQTEVPRKPPEKSSSLTLVTADLFKLFFFFQVSQLPSCSAVSLVVYIAPALYFSFFPTPDPSVQGKL